MNETNEITRFPFWQWNDEGLPKELCEIVMRDMETMNDTDASIGAGYSNQIVKKIRNSKVRWADSNYWLEGIMFNYGRYANYTAGWNFNIWYPEHIQLTSYSKKQHYDWHEDWSPLDSSKDVRKVSVVILLNDPSEFEGGEFEFKHEGKVDLKQGSVIAFPSFLQHRVNPVTKGIRKSAVCWIAGPKTL